MRKFNIGRKASHAFFLLRIAAIRTETGYVNTDPTTM
jgi:hypothetical protein